MKGDQKSSFDNPAYRVEYLTQAVILLQSEQLFMEYIHDSGHRPEGHDLSLSGLSFAMRSGVGQELGASGTQVKPSKLLLSQDSAGDPLQLREHQWRGAAWAQLWGVMGSQWGVGPGGAACGLSCFPQTALLKAPFHKEFRLHCLLVKRLYYTGQVKWC